MIFNPLIVVPILFTVLINLIYGNYWKNNPPKEINKYYGYRTKTSMKTQERWDFSQKVGAQKMIKYSYYLSLSSFLGFLIKIEYVGLSISISVICIILWAFMLIYKTEMAIRRKFE